MQNRDEQFMRTALECAAQGRSAVEPNPMVGAVIVRDGEEIARGWHHEFGGPHAEREALAAAASSGADVTGATMVVTLEPCCHTGKTPPCTEAILEAGIARVVIAMIDPDENVSGRGIAILRGAGVDVTVGVCEAEAREFLAAYIKLRTRGRPWVICKWAQTADGYLALPEGAGRWISSPLARARVHEIRSGCDGILVGAGTVLADDPLLTNRSGAGKQPVRVVLDSHLRTPLDCQLVRTAGESPVIVATASPAAPDRTEALRTTGVEVLELPLRDELIDLDALLDELGRRHWTYLLVEGGTTVLESFTTAELADELLVFLSPVELGEQAMGLPRFDIADLDIECAEETVLGDDVMRRYVVRGE